MYLSALVTELLLACNDEIAVMVMSVLATDHFTLTLHPLLYRYGPDSWRQR